MMQVTSEARENSFVTLDVDHILLLNWLNIKLSVRRWCNSGINC